jgi:hypothetical protein
MDTCSVCRYWQGRTLGREGPPTAGYCRIKAPTIVMQGSMQVSAFPVVSADAWCGEWEAKQAKRETHCSMCNNPMPCVHHMSLEGFVAWGLRGGA